MLAKLAMLGAISSFANAKDDDQPQGARPGPVLIQTQVRPSNPSAKKPEIPSKRYKTWPESIKVIHNEQASRPDQGNPTIEAFFGRTIPGLVVRATSPFGAHEINDVFPDFDFRQATLMDLRTGRVFVAAGEDGVVIVSQPLTGIEKVIHPAPGFPGEARALTTSGRNVYVAFGELGLGKINMDTLEFKLPVIFKGQRNFFIPAQGVTDDPDNNKVYIGAGSQRRVYVLDSDTDTLEGYYETSEDVRTVRAFGAFLYVNDFLNQADSSSGLYENRTYRFDQLKMHRVRSVSDNRCLLDWFRQILR